MLEAPPNKPHPPTTEPRPASQPLPPIPPSDERPRTDPLLSNAERRGDDAEELYDERMKRTHSWTDDNFAKARRDAGMEEERGETKKEEPKAAWTAAATMADEPVFLTQVGLFIQGFPKRTTP